MTVNALPTPNPNAMKFSVGGPVGGPTTFVAGQETDNPVAKDLLAVAGVSSIFMTADFVTITRTPGSSWEEITSDAVAILETHFGA